MSKNLWLIFVSLIVMAALELARAGEQASPAVYVSRTSSEASFQLIATKPCCYNDGEYFYSSPSTCRKYGGRVVRYEYCERQFYGYDSYDGYGGYKGKPCCYNSGQFFNATPQTCRRYGGRVVHQDRCDRYYDDTWGDYGTAPNTEKPCCYNNGRYYNSTPKTCRKYGGQTVPQRYCLGGGW